METVWIPGLTAPVALAAVALFGYVVGRRQVRRRQAAANAAWQEAAEVAQQLEQLSQTIRRRLAEHHAHVNRFCHRLRDQLDAEPRIPATGGSTWIAQAAEVLEPSQVMTRDLADTYEEIRQQTNRLTHLKRHCVARVH